MCNCGRFLGTGFSHSRGDCYECWKRWKDAQKPAKVSKRREAIPAAFEGEGVVDFAALPKKTKPCAGCPGGEKAKINVKTIEGGPVVWAVGVTTVPSRFGDLLPRTLLGIRRAGFNVDRVFVDGCLEVEMPDYLKDAEIAGIPHVTCRYPRVRTAANWWLSLLELYVRDPHCDRYAIFQDDVSLCRNVRQYLDGMETPKTAYWNLFSFLDNEKIVTGKRGFVEAAKIGSTDPDVTMQAGRGALALVFPQAAVVDLLSSRHWVERPMDRARGHKAVDGGIVTSLNNAGWREMVHAPSLARHLGEVSTTNEVKVEGKVSMKRWTRDAETFPGESFDALELAR